jgi:hypothetical protein
MPRFYSDPSRESDKWSLPDAEVFELTPQEQIESGLWEDELRQTFLDFNCKFNRDDLVEKTIEEHGIKTAWFY